MSNTEFGEDNSNTSSNTEANQVLTEKWPQIISYYKQINIDNEKQNIKFKCLLCCPKEHIISTSLTSNSNLRTHIKVSWYLILIILIWKITCESILFLFDTKIEKYNYV